MFVLKNVVDTTPSIREFDQKIELRSFLDLDGAPLFFEPSGYSFSGLVGIMDTNVMIF
jgi:hypothetical protein